MILIQVIFVILSVEWVSCTIAGLSYMDSLKLKPPKPLPSGEDPCNPLYWYPRNIPEYCYYKNTPKTDQKLEPVPLPIPIPLPPQPLPVPIAVGPMMPAPPPSHMPPSYPIPFPPMPPIAAPIYQPPMPLPYGIPIAPTNPMLPVAAVPAMSYPSRFPLYRPRYQAGMVPGLPGIVTHDGGINILPFSDAYADLLEKHKQKMIRRKIARVIDEYNGFPEKRRWRKRGDRRHRISRY